MDISYLLLLLFQQFFDFLQYNKNVMYTFGIFLYFDFENSI